MTITKLNIQFDLQPENRIDILEDVAYKYHKRYLFVDSSNGHCYLFDKDGNEDNIKKIKSIRDYAFWNNQCLESIVIPNSVKSIGNFAFEKCINLKSVVIPDSVRSIENGAFACCENLKSIEIPDSVKNIKHYAFAVCKSLKLVEIPDSVESIGNWAFASCQSLKSLIFKGKTINQVKAMKNYPFSIEDELIIKCI